VAGRIRGIHEQQLRSIWYCSSIVNGVLCFMNRELIASKRPARLVLAHWAVSAIALAAVIVVQVDWDSFAGPFAANNRPAFAGAVNIAATAWLLATAWLHASAARARRPLYVGAGRLRLHAATDLAIGALAVVVLFQGHESPVARAGLWAIPPALLAISIPSAIVLGQAARTSQPPASESSRVRFDWLRIVISAALLVLLGWIAMATVWRGP
jgi:hypothetical protein